MTYEVFEEDRPSYVSSYIMSAFLLAGLVTVPDNILVWPPSLATAFFALWFGVLFYWIILNARERRVFISHRLSISADTYRHSFRYAVAEHVDVEIPLSEITHVRLTRDEPRLIEVIGKSDSDLYFLPSSADPEQLAAAIKTGNPEVKITVAPWPWVSS